MKPRVLFILLLGAAGVPGWSQEPPAANVPALTPQQAQRDMTGVEPQTLVAEYVDDVSKIAGGFPELSGFREYARSRATPLEVVYSRGLHPIRTKRGIMPSDFDPQGIHLLFMLRGDDDPVAAQSHQITDLPNLRLTLYADVALARNASAGLEQRLQAIAATYRALLKRLDGEAAGKPEAGRGK